MKRKRYLPFFLLLALFGPLSATPTTQPVLIVLGTRPEAIKMLPVYQALQAQGIFTLLCSTGQHAELLQEVFKVFDIQPHYDFKVMKPNQDLSYLTQAVMEKANKLYQEVNPSLVLVQGDTTTAMAAALAAFYLKIPICHVEAGLRSGNRDKPFPEELNRKIISLIASYHFTPTSQASQNLIGEGIKNEDIFCTGNTTVDALQWVSKQIASEQLSLSPNLKELIQARKAKGDTLLLLTAHRRESFNGGLHRIFQAVKHSLEDNPNLFVVYPMHPNPSIKTAADEVGLTGMQNLLITPPLSYQDLVYVLSQSDLVATDSGGIQEEAATLNKPVLVLREETDRPEAINEGSAFLVGTSETVIYNQIAHHLKDPASTKGPSATYGDGQASSRIASIIEQIIHRDPL